MIRLAAVVLTVLLGFPALAAAHGGSVVADGSNDAYDVRVQIADITQDGAPAADVTVYPLAGGSLDEEATTTVAVNGETYDAAFAEGAYEVVIPIDEPRAWEDWEVGARVVGDAGSITVGDFPDEPVVEEEEPTETTGATGDPGGVTAPPETAPAEVEEPTATTGDDDAATSTDDADDDGAPGWLIPVSAVLLAAAVALVVQRRRAMRDDENPVS